MRKVAFAAAYAALVCVSGNALAADLSLKDVPEYESTPMALMLPGFYVGGSIGGAMANSKVSDTYDYYGDPFAQTDLDNTGFITSATLGYNWQRGNVVLGIEGDIGYMDISASESRALPVAGDHGLNGTYETKGGLYGDLTGRLGYATGNTLLYLKGGVAFLNTDFSSNYVGENCSTAGTCSGAKPAANSSKFNFEDSDTMVGWTIGAGVEYALGSNWSLKAEYQYFDFGTQSFDYAGSSTFAPSSTCKSCRDSTLTGNTDIDYTVNAVKLGLNYRFNGGDAGIK